MDNVNFSLEAPKKDVYVMTFIPKWPRESTAKIRRRLRAPDRATRVKAYGHLVTRRKR